MKKTGPAQYGPEIVLDPYYASSIQIVDIDQDGDNDVLATIFETSSVAFYRNLGSGQFANREDVTSGVPSPYGCDTADFNNDGHIDVLYSSGINDYVAVAYADGLGGFHPATIVAANVDTPYRNVAADINGDGLIDIVSLKIGGTDEITWQRNLGSVGFGNRLIIAMPSNVNFNQIKVADVNGDGLLDIIYAIAFQAGAETTGIIYSLGSGFWGQLTTLTTGNEALNVEVVDMDMDGDLDIISSYQISQRIVVSYNNGGGSFSNYTWSDNVCYPTMTLGSDVDGDGDTDLLISCDTPSWSENGYVATTSTATPFGAGCGTPPMVFTPTSTAITGQAVTGEITHTPTPFCVVSFGTSNTFTAAGAPLPFNLNLIGMTGCTLYQSAEVPGLPTVGAGVAFQMNFSMGIPANPLLVGQHFYLQAFSIDPNAAPRKVISSNGIDFLIGNQ